MKKAADVFVSCPDVNTDFGAAIASGLSQLGLKTTRYADIPLDVDDVWETIRSAIATCRCFVVIAPSSESDSPGVMFELGVALGWSKPVFVVRPPGVARPPFVLASYRMYTIADLQRLAADIKSSLEDLSETEIDRLLSVYRDMNKSVDKIAIDPDLTRQMTAAFNSNAKVKRGSDLLLAELMRRRKSRRLG